MLCDNTQTVISRSAASRLISELAIRHAFGVRSTLTGCLRESTIGSGAAEAVLTRPTTRFKVV